MEINSTPKVLQKPNSLLPTTSYQSFFGLTTSSKHKDMVIKTQSFIRTAKVQSYLRRMVASPAAREPSTSIVDFTSSPTAHQYEEPSIEYCPMEEMVGDFLTKPLQGKLFYKFQGLIMNLNEWYSNSLHHRSLLEQIYIYQEWQNIQDWIYTIPHCSQVHPRFNQSTHSYLDAVLNDGVVMMAANTAIFESLAFGEELIANLFTGVDTVVSTIVTDTNTNGSGLVLEL